MQWLLNETVAQAEEHSIPPEKMSVQVRSVSLILIMEGCSLIRRTPPFHGGNVGANPISLTYFLDILN